MAILPIREKWRWKWACWYHEMTMKLRTSLLRLYKNILKGSFYSALTQAGNAGIFGAFPAFFIGHYLSGLYKNIEAHKMACSNPLLQLAKYRCYTQIINLVQRLAKTL